jgi:PLP dependent protein
MSTFAAREVEIAGNLAAVQRRIIDAAERCGRMADEITLIAVTKTYPVSDVKILYDLGLRNFGENRDQEGAVKAPALPSDATWHFQGQIQSNKLKSIANWAQVIHSIDDLGHAKKLNNLSLGKEIFIQVSLDTATDTATRGGVELDQVPGFISEVMNLANLRVLGLMAVAPLNIEPVTAFKKLAQLAGEIRSAHPAISKLSAGMSNDFEEAIGQGATHIRLGSQILGVR